MRAMPPLTKLLNYPVVGGIAMLAIAVTLADQLELVDISPLLENEDVRRGQVWRLATSALPHVDVIHLLFNVYWLWVFGSLVEEVFGHVRTFVLILLLAVGSGAAEYAFVHGGVGLSGVGYGLFGFLWVLCRRDERFRDAVDPQTVSLFVAWFFLCIVTTYAGVWNVANLAHGVGAALGALAGMVVTAKKLRPVYGSLLVLLVAGFGAAVYARPYVNLTDERAYERAQLGYDALEKDDDEAAVRHYRAAIAAAKGDPDSAWWFNLGLAYERLENFPASKDAYQRAVDLDPSEKDYGQTLRGIERILKGKASPPADADDQTLGKTNVDAPATTRSIERP